MSKLKNFILELFFPSRCAVCNKIGSFFCESCRQKILFIKEQTCPKCNKIYSSGKYCKRCRKEQKLQGIIASTYFKDESAKKIIHELKYRGYFAVAPTLAEIITQNIKAEGIRFDLVAPAPISKKRLRQRGYNQSEEIAKRIVEISNKKLLVGLKKIKETKPQVGLKKKDREKNLIGAFTYLGPDITGKRILLVDDVKTTGATLSACAAELKKAGAKEVWGVVFAKE